MKITKHNKIYCEIVDYEDYIQFLNKEIYNDGIIHLTNIKEVLPKIDESIISHTKLVKNIKNKIRTKYPKVGSAFCVDYYLVRGYTKKESKDKISKIQRKNSERCIEHWFNKGYTELEAISKVKVIQDTSSIEYFIKKYGEVIGKEKYKDKSIKCIITLETLIIKYGEDDGTKRWNLYLDRQSYSNSKEGIIENHGLEKGFKILKSKGRSGKDNSQYGKPAPTGAGRGISGYYKEYYFRSLFEYHAIKYFEDNDISFIELDKQNSEVIIRVNLDNNRTYRPDFLINGNTIVEVKPAGLVQLPINQHKKDCCITQYPEYDYIYMTQNELDINIPQLKADVNNGLVIIDVGKKERYKRIYE